MEAEKKKNFVARISQANRSQLTVVIFDVIIDEITCAVKLWESCKNALPGQNRREMPKEDLMEYEDSLKMARNFTGELIDSLNLKYPLARELRPIYVFVNREIIYALLSGNAEKLGRVTDMMRKLRESFEEVSHQDFSEPLMENTQKIYAGLTYGKGQLNEISVDVNQASRGFKV